MIKKEDLLTVKQLREELNKLDSSYDDNIVVLSKDSEGNQYRVVSKDDFIATDYKFVPEYCGWCGDIYLRKLTDKFIKLGYNELDLTDEEALDCIVIYPYN